MTCPTCAGHGILLSHLDDDGQLQPEETCPRCGGDGEIASRPQEHEEFEVAGSEWD